MFVPELTQALARLEAPEPVNVLEAREDFTKPGWEGVWQYPLTDGFPASELVTVVNGIETVPAAAACVGIYADTLADLPKFARGKGSRNERLPDHWVTQLLNEPNVGINKTKFWRWVGREIAAMGECYLGIERDQYGMPMEFTPARISGTTTGGLVDAPGAMVMLRIPNGVFGQASITKQYRSEDVLHFTDGEYDPFYGRSRSPLECTARNPIGTYRMIWTRYVMRMAQGGHDTVFVNMPENEEEWNAFANRYAEKAAGTRNAGKTFPIPHGSAVNALKLTDVERETVAMLQFLIVDIARAWRVPPFMIAARLAEGVSARARSDLAEQFLNWQRMRYAAFVKSITSELDMKLLGPLTLAGSRSTGNLVIEFDLDHMTMGTLEGRSRIAVALHAGGVITKNEARGLVDFDQIAGGDELPQVRGAPADTGRKGTSEAGDEPNEPDEDE